MSWQGRMSEGQGPQQPTYASGVAAPQNMRVRTSGSAAPMVSGGWSPPAPPPPPKKRPQQSGPVGQPTPNPYNLPPDLAEGYGDAIYQEFEDATQAAKQGNIRRFKEAKQGYKQLEADWARREQRLGGLLEGFGEAQQEELDRQFEQQRAGLTQAQIGRGMFSTSAAAAQERGLTHEQGQQQRQLQDMLTRQKMDYLTGLSADTLRAQGQGGYLGLLERVNETGPDPNQLGQLATMIGAGQAGTPDYLSGLGYAEQQIPEGREPGTMPGPKDIEYKNPSIPRGPTSKGPVLRPREDREDPRVIGRPPEPERPGPLWEKTGPGGEGDGEYDPGKWEVDVDGMPPDLPSGGDTDTGPGGGGDTDTDTDGDGETPKGGGGGSTGQLPADITGNTFWKTHIAPRLAKDPSWDWASDMVLRTMMPTNLQQRVDTILKNRRAAASGGGGGGGRSGHGNDAANQAAGGNL